MYLFLFLAELNPKDFYEMGLEKGSIVILTFKLKWIRIL